ncbi:hypothetical protein [Burkholderia stagnalis]|uniref:glycine-rich domain-containing protein n=1 Tax=Burkholderia stagnalis TaxID=1503054 RepID=UPI000B1F821D|nr:hypothetical protein [Burkholderia stagnalis]
MDRLIATNSVPLSGADTAPATGTPQYATTGNPATNTPATVFPAYAWNAIQEELVAVIAAGGIVLDRTNNAQMAAAIKRISQSTIVLADTGAANAYTATNATPLVAGTWVDGVVQAVKIAHANTGASTYAPDGLAAIPIYGLGLQPLQGGELALNGTAILMRATIAGVNSGNPICVLMECGGGAQQVALATQSAHALQAGQALGLFLGVQVFTSSGTYTPGTYTVGGRSVTATKARFRLVGGGGGGGGVNATNSAQAAAACGGNGGEYIEALVASGLSAQSITIGAAGAGGAAGFNNGSQGGTTSVGSLVSAIGGNGGAAGGAGAPPYVNTGQANNGGGIASGSMYLRRGCDLGGAGLAMSLTYVLGGNGGGSPFSANYKGGSSPPTGSYGGGGGGAAIGASGSALGGANGSSGIVVVEEYA